MIPAMPHILTLDPQRCSLGLSTYVCLPAIVSKSPVQRNYDTRNSFYLILLKSLVPTRIVVFETIRNFGVDSSVARQSTETVEITQHLVGAPAESLISNLRIVLWPQEAACLLPDVFDSVHPLVGELSLQRQAHIFSPLGRFWELTEGPLSPKWIFKSAQVVRYDRWPAVPNHVNEDRIWKDLLDPPYAERVLRMLVDEVTLSGKQIGRASCRER